MTPDYYVQLLEGERAVVNTCYERICRDPRPSHVGLILFEVADDRLFPDWSMLAVDLSEGDPIALYTEGKEFRPEKLPRAVVSGSFGTWPRG